jgi:hypothetical protein
MGYTTKFSGQLRFKKEVTSTSLGKLKGYCGIDCRHTPELKYTGFTYIDIKITDDFSGIEWDGSEKTYDLVEKINLVISEMKKEYPDFGLEGEMIAQGESFGDVWKLKMNDGVAIREDIALKGKKVSCPHCGEDFMLEE